VFWEDSRKKIDLVVMDMWRDFEKSTRRMCPGQQFPTTGAKWSGNLGKAIDAVCKQGNSRVADKGRSFIKGQKHTQLSNRENLKPEGKKTLKKLHKPNRYINSTHLLKELLG